MTHQELIQSDFQAKAAVIEAERSFIRSQIALLEAQLKQNAVKGQELEHNWNTYVENVKKAQEQQNGAQLPVPEAVKTNKKVAAPKA